jgi:hypothetical protein
MKITVRDVTDDHHHTKQRPPLSAQMVPPVSLQDVIVFLGYLIPNLFLQLRTIEFIVFCCVGGPYCTILPLCLLM